MIDYEIRPVRAEDRDAVEALLRRAELPPDGLDEQFGDAYAVAVAEGRIVGAAGVEVYGDAGLLRSVAVDPEWRGRGLGAALTRERLAWAEARGLGDVYLLTNTAADYFPKLGFAPVAREKVPEAVRGSVQFASVCPSSAAVMVLSLGGVPCATP
ncbi:arsenic resistance N-acetyltransferase ArsN2 [Longimicrobium sp.]|uniref:arsenic resistance N-acetyltransferase ArsN2 n=1 Tax=Longimicrobium sp. TaxID=2029185 RepID=UPI002CD0F350|nr:arsenic resistance N-acetyltransferase ArsN2 [Longimicrobium sp.]HSU15782.1 arsenic resistance N-acetyltransferase ArsN2 [Longimicrobium sp.]